MLYSMTAFARETTQRDWGAATWEIRSVNHRFLETMFRLPDAVKDLEMPLRESVRNTLNRGKLDISLQLKLTIEETDIEVNLERAKKCINAASQIAELLPQSILPSALDILKWPGVIKDAEYSLDTVKEDLLTLFQHTLAQLAESRAREGEKLKLVILDKLDAINEEIKAVRACLPQLLEAQRNRIVKKLLEVTENLNMDRLEQELTYLAQRADVAEEMDRLDTHVIEIRRVLNKHEPMGRRLDFLLQELNREANTLSSKSLASESTQSAVELKVLIEQIREQVQNIE